MSDLISKALGKGKPKGTAYNVTQDSFLRQLPTIAEFLTFTGGGKVPVRQTATLNLSFGSGGFVAMLKDRESQQLTFGNGDTLEEALGGLEASLAEGTAVWRADRYGKPGKRS